MVLWKGLKVKVPRKMFAYPAHLENACSSLMMQIECQLLYRVAETNTGFGVSQTGIQIFSTHHNWLSDFEWQVVTEP